jgi:hypothetical protein
MRVSSLAKNTPSKADLVSLEGSFYDAGKANAADHFKDYIVVIRDGSSYFTRRDYGLKVFDVTIGSVGIKSKAEFPEFISPALQERFKAAFFRGVEVGEREKATRVELIEKSLEGQLIDPIATIQSGGKIIEFVLGIEKAEKREFFLKSRNRSALVSIQSISGEAFNELPEMLRSDLLSEMAKDPSAELLRLTVYPPEAKA